MANNPAKSAPDIETLKKRHRDLENQRIAAQTNLDTANKQLEQFKAEAREQFGTDDLEELKQKLDQIKRDNERKRIEYDQHLAEVEKNLSQVEQDRQNGE